ncbi:hypothetical protein CsSME_00026873 [Camellia sinensis var. sinensis]
MAGGGGRWREYAHRAQLRTVRFLHVYLTGRVDFLEIWSDRRGFWRSGSCSIVSLVSISLNIRNLHTVMNCCTNFKTIFKVKCGMVMHCSLISMIKNFGRTTVFLLRVGL